MLTWTRAISDILISLSFFSILAALLIVLRKRPDLVFKPLFIAAFLYILLSGSRHLANLIALLVPADGMQAAFAVGTGLCSLVIAALLWCLLPRIIALPSPAQMRHVNTALNEAIGQLKLAEQIAGIGHWRLALPKRTLHWSDGVFQVFGFDPAAGMPALSTVLQSYHPDDVRPVSEHLDHVIANGLSYSMHSRITRRGQLRYLESRGIPERDENGELAAVFGVIVDKTDTIAAARAETEIHELNLRARMAVEATQAKSRFLASVSHELRTPLNGVLGNAQLLRMEGDLSETQRARIDTMVQAGDHLLQMISRVLNLSEIEADHVILEAEDVEVTGLAKLCLELIRPAATQKRLALALSASPDLPTSLKTDPLRLRQVLLNLAGNAVKFTQSGSVTLHLGLSDDADRLRIEVADTGPGITREQRQRLFRDYERLDAANVATIEGAGLGLAISARLVALMGGALGHLDRPGGGSIFWLELPCRATADPPAPAPAAAPAAPPDAASSAPCPLRILVADDVAMNRDIAQAFLRANGHHVAAVESGEQALQALEDDAFDAVFMDVRMEGMSGLDAARRIRAGGHGNPHIPIVALTAAAFAEQIDECRLAGMNGHATKPFTPQSLEDALRAALAEASREEEKQAVLF